MRYTITVLVFCASLDVNVCQTNNIKKSYNVITRSNWDFTSAIYASIANATGPTANIVFSPLSMHVIMAVCYIGAGGKTAEQMSNALRLPNNPAVVKFGFRKLIRILMSSKKVSLLTANKVYPSTNYPLSRNFLNITKAFFRTDVQNLNYGDTSTAAETINGWVANTTRSKITGIVLPSSLKPSTTLLLVNTIYFEGAWKVVFDEADTYSETFYVDGKVQRQLPTMHATRKFGFKEYREIGARVLELSYKDEGSTSLLIILPTKRDGLQEVEAKLSQVDLREFVLGSTFKVKELRVSLPKFTTYYSTQMGDVLSAMGMKDLFGLRADLSRMTSLKGMHVDDVLHKATIEVNEGGTVAAAATAAGVGFRSFSARAVEFVVDHPFVFALVSRRAKVVLFAGRFTGEAPVVMRSMTGYGEEAARAAGSLTADRLLLEAMMTVWLLRTLFPTHC